MSMFYTSFSEKLFLLGLLIFISVQFKKSESKLDCQAYRMMTSTGYISFCNLPYVASNME